MITRVVLLLDLWSENERPQPRPGAFQLLSTPQFTTSNAPSSTKSTAPTPEYRALANFHSGLSNLRLRLPRGFFCGPLPLLLPSPPPPPSSSCSTSSSSLSSPTSQVGWEYHRPSPLSQAAAQKVGFCSALFDLIWLSRSALASLANDSLPTDLDSIQRPWRSLPCPPRSGGAAPKGLEFYRLPCRRRILLWYVMFDRFGSVCRGCTLASSTAYPPPPDKRR